MFRYLLQSNIQNFTVSKNGGFRCGLGKQR